MYIYSLFPIHYLDKIIQTLYNRVVILKTYECCKYHHIISINDIRKHISYETLSIYLGVRLKKQVINIK